MPLLQPYTSISFKSVEIEEGLEDEAWASIQEITEYRLTDEGCRLLRSGLDECVRQVLIEAPYLCRDFRSLHSNFYSRKFRERPARCHRLHFFSKPYPVERILVSDAQEHYLGASVIEPLVRRCIGRTIIDPYKLGKDTESFFSLAAEFQHRIGGATYRVKGYPHRSQDEEATVCAHATMWSVCRFLSQRYPIYKETLPFDLIQMVGKDNGRAFPKRGMTFRDYCQILDSFGCHPVVLSPTGVAIGNDKRKKQQRLEDFRDDLYAYVESGFPVVASFGDHVVSIVGHTDGGVIDPAVRSESSQSREIVNASELIGDYIVVDDNEFPYQQMKQTAVADTGDNCYPRTTATLQHVVVPLPDETYLEPGDARRRAVELLRQQDIQNLVDRMLVKLDISASEPLVFRQFLTTGTAFKRRKLQYWSEASEDQKDVGLRVPEQISLPKFIWVIELSVQSLRLERRIFGEIILDATAGLTDLEEIYVRIGTFLTDFEKTENDRPTSGLQLVEQLQYYSFPAFRHNLGPHDEQGPSHIVRSE